MSDTQMLQPGEPAPMRGESTIKALILYLRGNAWMEFGRLDLAIADYDAALALNPMLTAALAERGAAWAQQGNFERALADYDMALRINPHDVGTRMNFTLALGKQDETETESPVVLN